PEPSRTISFSRAMTSKAGPAGPSAPSTSPTRATTMWNEFVPMSMAASGRSVTASLLPQPGFALHPTGRRDHGRAVVPTGLAGGALDRARDAHGRDHVTGVVEHRGRHRGHSRLALAHARHPSPVAHHVGPVAVVEQEPARRADVEGQAG